MEKRKICREKKCCILFFCLALHVLLCSFGVMAAEQIDTNANVSMTIQYTKNNRKVAGASFQVYHVADVTESGQYVVTDAFKNYPISFAALEQEGWQQLALTLKGYVRRDGIKEIDSGKTDSDGVLVFPSKDMTWKPGLYLVVGQTREIGRYTYYATPFLIRLPGLDASGNANLYQVNVTPKCRYDYDDPEDKGITRKVLKVWKDAGSVQKRPKSITVQLLRDDKVYDTVTLSANNNWRYTWEDLRRGYDWTVVEKEIDGYTVNVTQEGITFIVTNTFIPEKPGGPGSEPDDLDRGTEIEDSKVPFGAGNKQPTGIPTLPQTGQLWWPIPILVCCGLFCIVVGVIRHRGACDEE